MPKGVNELTGDILHACIKIHTKLDPGLLESVYENVLRYELEKLGYTVEQQKPIPVIYDDIKFEDGFHRLFNNHYKENTDL